MDYVCKGNSLFQVFCKELHCICNLFFWRLKINESYFRNQASEMTWTCFGVEMIKRIQICKQLYRTIQPFLSADVNGEILFVPCCWKYFCVSAHQVTIKLLLIQNVSVCLVFFFSPSVCVHDGYLTFCPFRKLLYQHRESVWCKTYCCPFGHLWVGSYWCLAQIQWLLFCTDTSKYVLKHVELLVCCSVHLEFAIWKQFGMCNLEALNSGKRWTQGRLPFVQWRRALEWMQLSALGYLAIARM